MNFIILIQLALLAVASAQNPAKPTKGDLAQQVNQLQALYFAQCVQPDARISLVFPKQGSSSARSLQLDWVYSDKSVYKKGGYKSKAFQELA